MSFLDRRGANGGSPVYTFERRRPLHQRPVTISDDSSDEEPRSRQTPSSAQRTEPLRSPGAVPPVPSSPPTTIRSRSNDETLALIRERDEIQRQLDEERVQTGSLRTQLEVSHTVAHQLRVERVALEDTNAQLHSKVRQLEDALRKRPSTTTTGSGTPRSVSPVPEDSKGNRSTVDLLRKINEATKLIDTANAKLGETLQEHTKHGSESPRATLSTMRGGIEAAHRILDTAATACRDMMQQHFSKTDKMHCGIASESGAGGPPQRSGSSSGRTSPSRQRSATPKATEIFRSVRGRSPSPSPRSDSTSALARTSPPGVRRPVSPTTFRSRTPSPVPPTAHRSRSPRSPKAATTKN